MRTAGLLVGALVVAGVNIASVVPGFWISRLVGDSSQVLVQLPVAIVTGVCGVVVWLRRGKRLHGLEAGAGHLRAALLALPFGAAVFFAAHYLVTGYPTSFGNIVALWAIQVIENAIAMPIAGSGVCAGASRPGRPVDGVTSGRGERAWP